LGARTTSRKAPFFICERTECICLRAYLERFPSKQAQKKSFSKPRRTFYFSSPPDWKIIADHIHLVAIYGANKLSRRKSKSALWWCKCTQRPTPYSCHLFFH
jgi:hypothetical protein